MKGKTKRGKICDFQKLAVSEENGKRERKMTHKRLQRLSKETSLTKKLLSINAQKKKIHIEIEAKDY